jgi:uncharacterized membrane protein
MDDSSTDDPDERLAAAAVTLLTLLVAFGGLALGVPFWWVAFPVGFGGVLPLVVALVRRREGRERTAERTERSDALEQLRSRYARGEIDEAEFERRVEGLLETETDADAEAYADRQTRERTEPATEAGTERER